MDRLLQHVTNFEWYVSVLVELTRIEGTKHGNLIADQVSISRLSVSVEKFLDKLLYKTNFHSGIMDVSRTVKKLLKIFV
jgi:hypothetical protein